MTKFCCVCCTPYTKENAAQLSCGLVCELELRALRSKLLTQARQTRRTKPITAWVGGKYPAAT